MAEAHELTGTRHSRNLPISIEGLALALTRPIPITILCAAALLKACLVFSILPTRVKDWDFDLYYVSALALRENQNPYTVDYKALAARLGIAVTPDWKSHDTPTLLVFFEPLTKLPMKEAFWIWTSLNVVALTVTLFMLLRPSTTGLSPPMGLTIAAMTILYDPVAMNFEYAQRQIVILLLLVVAIRAMERNYDWPAGIMLSAAGLLRAFPLLLMVYLALARRWRTLRCAAISLVAGGFITIVMVGVPCVDFLRALGWTSQRKFLELSVNPALGPTVSRFFWFTSGFGLGAQHDALRRVAIVLAEAIILAMTVRATGRIERRDRDWRAFSLWLITSIILSPIAWPHYLALLIIPYVQLAIAGRAGRIKGRLLLMALGSYMVVQFSRRSGGVADLPVMLKALLEEFSSVSLLMAFIATYWFVTDYRISDQTSTAEVAHATGAH
jgi:hypothetical protein